MAALFTFSPTCDIVNLLIFGCAMGEPKDGETDYEFIVGIWNRVVENCSVYYE